jgi:hypothetical protein
LPAASAIVLAPGVVGIVRLHPYEYVYYNELVGGVRGAYGQFELDYWCTSYREAVQAVNRIAPPAAKVAIWGPHSAAEPFLREDLIPTGVPAPAEALPSDGTLALGCSWATTDPSFYPAGEIVWTLERDGAVMAVIKQPAPMAAPTETE